MERKDEERTSHPRSNKKTFRVGQIDRHIDREKRNSDGEYATDL